MLNYSEKCHLPCKSTDHKLKQHIQVDPQHNKISLPLLNKKLNCYLDQSSNESCSRPATDICSILQQKEQQALDYVNTEFNQVFQALQFARTSLVQKIQNCFLGKQKSFRNRQQNTRNHNASIQKLEKIKQQLKLKKLTEISCMDVFQALKICDSANTNSSHKTANDLSYALQEIGESLEQQFETEYSNLQHDVDQKIGHLLFGLASVISIQNTSKNKSRCQNSSRLVQSKKFQNPEFSGKSDESERASSNERKVSNKSENDPSYEQQLPKDSLERCQLRPPSQSMQYNNDQQQNAKQNQKQEEEQYSDFQDYKDYVRQKQQQDRNRIAYTALDGHQSSSDVSSLTQLTQQNKHYNNEFGEDNEFQGKGTTIQKESENRYQLEEKQAPNSYWQFSNQMNSEQQGQQQQYLEYDVEYQQKIRQAEQRQIYENCKRSFLSNKKAQIKGVDLPEYEEGYVYEREERIIQHKNDLQANDDELLRIALEESKIQHEKEERRNLIQNNRSIVEDHEQFTSLTQEMQSIRQPFRGEDSIFGSVGSPERRQFQESFIRMLEQSYMSEFSESIVPTVFRNQINQRDPQILRIGCVKIRDLMNDKFQLVTNKTKFNLFVKILRPLEYSLAKINENVHRKMKVFVTDETGTAVLYTSFNTRLKPGVAVRLDNCTLSEYRNFHEISNCSPIFSENIIQEGDRYIPDSATQSLSNLITAQNGQKIYVNRSANCTKLYNCVQDLYQSMNEKFLMRKSPELFVSILSVVSRFDKTYLIGDYTGRMLARLDSGDAQNYNQGQTVRIYKPCIQKIRGQGYNFDREEKLMICMEAQTRINRMDFDFDQRFIPETVLSKYSMA